MALTAIIGLALSGALLFGAWHVVVGGLAKGNPRAAEFGLVLATVSGIALAVLAFVSRRLRGGRQAAGERREG